MKHMLKLVDTGSMLAMNVFLIFNFVQGMYTILML